MAQNKGSRPLPSQALELWQATILAGLGGLAQTLSWPWPGLWPLIFFCLIPLLLAIDGQNLRRAFFLGWVYGLAQFASSQTWLVDVVDGYGGVGPILGWLAIAALGAAYAIFAAVFAWLSARGNFSPPTLLWCLTGAIAWAGLDWLKNFGPMGYNWTPLAGPLALEPELGQAADLIGFYGLGFLVAFINFLGALYLLKKREASLTARTNIYLCGALAIVVALWAYGLGKSPYWNDVSLKSPKETVIAIQPCVEQSDKWDPALRAILMENYLQLTKEAAAQKPWFILWPETAMPFIYDYDANETAWLNDLAGFGDVKQLVGLAGLSGFWPEQQLRNRMVLFVDGEPGPYYDKHHLVPFGEYLPPWFSFLEWGFLRNIIGAVGSYSPGDRLPPLVMPLGESEDEVGVPLGILICFESIFPRLAREKVLAGAELLVVPTNDAWFGRSRAPEQHLWQAAMRAIETRRPVVRAANTGISALIYPSGQIVSRYELYEYGAFPLEVPILAPETLEQTFFVRYGYYLSPILAALTALLALWRILLRARKK